MLSITTFASRYNELALTDRIYRVVLFYLRNPRLRKVSNANEDGFRLHEITRRTLSKENGLSTQEIDALEDSIRSDIDAIQYGEIVQDVPRALNAELKKDRLEEAVSKHGIAPLPSPLENALICAELLKQFSQNELLRCPGFALFTKLDIDGKPVTVIRLDIDASIVRNGFIVPIIKSRMINSLRVYRHPNDTRPFILRSRNYSKTENKRW